MKCIQCNVEYEAKRASSRYCSGVCRVNAARDRVSVTDSPEVSVTSVSVTSPVRTRTEGCQVSIPGDEDYTGACVKVDGVWKVDKTKDTRPLSSLTRP